MALTFNSQDFHLRTYQESIYQNSKSQNTLVVLPTGLGKTHIALALARDLLERNQNKKILFLAPTKPLVHQHYETFAKYFSPQDSLCEIHGNINIEKRKTLYDSCQIIFATPQTIRNDILSKKIDLTKFSLIVFDEAHRATGDYSYAQIAKSAKEQNPGCLFLALTASPGSNLDSIEQITKNLYIEHIEVRGRDHPQVTPHIKDIKTNFEVVELSIDLDKIRKLLDISILSRLRQLKNMGFLQNIKEERLSLLPKKRLIEMQKSILAQKNISNNWYSLKALSILSSILKLSHALNLLESESLKAFDIYMQQLFELSKTTKTKSVKDIVNDANVKLAYNLAKELLSQNIEHPKVRALKKIIARTLNQKPNAKIIIFSEYRNTVEVLKDSLSELFNLQRFVGQASKLEKGMSQKEQVKILNEFKEGKFNILVSTCVAEEGLDVPQVDLVVFYEPVSSAIRSIQRKGRTGRQEIGELVILITKDSKDEIYYWISKRKEKLMFKLLEEFNYKRKLINQTALEDTSSVPIQIEKERDDNNPLIQTDSGIAHKLLDTSRNPYAIGEQSPIQNNLQNNNSKLPIKIIIDNRESNSRLCSLLCEKVQNIEFSNLDIGDYVVGEDCIIERKSINDFISSILDKRIFDQISKLKEIKKPLLIIEGDKNKLLQTSLHENVIYSILLHILIDQKIPIFFTNDENESLLLILNFARREQLGPSDSFSPHAHKQITTLPQMQKYFISALPFIGPKLACRLLKKAKTIKQLINAKEERLQKVEGIGDKKAKILFDLFNQEYKEE